MSPAEPAASAAASTSISSKPTTTTTNSTATTENDPMRTSEQQPSLLPVTSGPRYVQYEIEKEHVYLKPIRALISKDLSEPYSIYVYRYFLNQWPDLCFMALDATTSSLRGVIICKLEPHKSGTYRGYIAMLATVSTHRGRGIGSSLAGLAIAELRARGADEVVLETETSNAASLRLYERLGFLRSKRLHRYYLNGSTAFRLALYLREGAGLRVPEQEGMGIGQMPQVVEPGEDDDGPGGITFGYGRSAAPAGVL